MPLQLPKPPGPANIKANISPTQFETVPLSVRFDDPKKQELIFIMAFFAYQSKQEKRFAIFEAHVCGRFLGEFPEPYAKDLPARISMTKAKIHAQLTGACNHQRQVMPRIHWENFIALPMEDILKLGRIIRTQAKETALIARKRTPGLRQDARLLAGQLATNRTGSQYAATEVAIKPSNPEGPTRTKDVSDDVFVPEEDQVMDERGELLELVIDLTLDRDEDEEVLDTEEELDTEDDESSKSVEDWEADMFLDD